MDDIINVLYYIIIKKINGDCIMCYWWKNGNKLFDKKKLLYCNLFYDFFLYLFKISESDIFI